MLMSWGHEGGAGGRTLLHRIIYSGPRPLPFMAPASPIFLESSPFAGLGDKNESLQRKAVWARTGNGIFTSALSLLARMHSLGCI